MTDVQRLERRSVERLRTYREIIHMELRDGQQKYIPFWRDLAHSVVKDIRLLRSL